jgi:predicted TIM-barrel fold metal-dependent hydrolase
VRLDSGKRWDDLWPGGYDPVARLADQDTDGVAAEVIYPSVGMLLCNHPEPDYQRACFRAYNEWIAEFCATAPDRLIGMGQTALRTPEEGVRDLEEIKALGLRGVMLPGIPPGNDYDDPMWGPLWDAIIDLELPPSFHILTSRSDTPFSPHIRGPKLNNFMSIVRGNQDIIGTLVFGAVFERHPDLRVVCVEADAGWAPHWMYRADHGYDRHRNWLTAGELTRRPSEWFAGNVYLTFQDDWVAFRVADLMNVERLMWANDFPHSDATWPNSQDLLAEHAVHLDEHARRRILHDNVAELYGITA